METAKRLSLPKPRIVLISGYKRSGKDSAAEVLVRDFEYHLLKFAGPIKELMLQFLLDVYGIEVSYADVDGQGIDRTKPLVGSEGATLTLGGKPLTLRWALQWFGTNIIRDHVGSTVWSNAVAEKIEDSGESFVISDCRFPDEAELIRKRFKDTHHVIVIRVKRPGTEPGPDAHASETAVDDVVPDLVIENVGSLADLEAKMHSV